ncbi:hypothetical protein G6L37_04835 [Agrobacterium rubi]|nr:hypothetical protein [Agrobacterium rubi]NTF24680.1 hypothetical protein [Agrobacterium rubi]
MLKRRDIVIIPILAAAAYTGGAISTRYAPQKTREPREFIGPIVAEDAFLASLHRTVSEKITLDQVGELVGLAKQRFDWVFHPLTRTEDFDRKICTEFVLNSNLPDISHDVSKYKFIEYPEACNPFASTT